MQRGKAPRPFLMFVCLFLVIARFEVIWAAASEPLVPALYDPLYHLLRDPRERQDGYEILINLPSFQLLLYRNGELLHRYPIAIGREVSPSLLITTRITNKVENPTYYPPDWAKKGQKPIPPGPENPVGTRWLGLSQKGYGIHGTNNPSSIGSAASAGCIRMHNKDVEQLAKIVPLGTPVTFVYQPLLIWYDLDTQWPMMHVLRDIYGRGGIDIHRALERLQQLQITEPVHMEALARMLSHPTSGSIPVPLLTEIEVVGYGSIPAYTTHTDTYVSLQALAAVLGTSNTGPGRNEEYVPLKAAAAACGVLANTELKRLEPVTLMHNGEALAVRTYLTSETLLVSVEALASLVGAPISWDAALKAPRVNGIALQDCLIIGDRAFAPYTTLAAALSIRIEWQPGRAVAELHRPLISIDTYSSLGLWHEDEVWLPVRLLAEWMGLTAIWDRAGDQVHLGPHIMPGFLQGGRAYASQNTVLSLFPEITALWNDLSATLELHIQGAPFVVIPGRLADARGSSNDSS